ncbi:ROK family protein [Kribbella qitaiheensis]|uniref:ROK family protein n=1 Tax=Kribbella qitaiheensis TaxID=1544730 RepID=A0A7G6WXF4_9ACTN|nr:ROK family protein [Kribbella qitaiheensis]QNE18669.1 ROK family protein [Kribbella qitaiheensis]
MGETEVVAVLEVGGSHVTAASVRPGSWQVEVAQRATLDSKGSAGAIVEALAAAARQLPLATGLAVALPGPFDYETGVAWYRLDKFAALYGLDLRKALRESLGVEQVVFLNDAEAFSVGEWAAGALRGQDRCVGVTIGTGIGSGFLDDGRAVRTGDSVPPGGELYRTDYRGKPLEDWISARAILRLYSERAGALPENWGVKEVADHARGGDAVARQVLLDTFGVLAEVLGGWLERFGASRVVLGGAISGAFDVVESVFPFHAAATADTEHSAILGAAAHFARN